MKREVLREQLWPGAEGLIWSRKANHGFTTVPRLLTLVMQLIRMLSSPGNPASVYLDLWLRAFDEGMVTVIDESVCAYSSGYSGTRALRTWREHIFKLQELGFISVKPEGLREIGHILLLNPLAVCTRHHSEGRVPDEWWSAFVRRAQEVGASLRLDTIEIVGRVLKGHHRNRRPWVPLDGLTVEVYRHGCLLNETNLVELMLKTPSMFEHDGKGNWRLTAEAFNFDEPAQVMI